MPRYIQLRAVAYDTVTLSAGQRTAVFFVDRQGEGVDDTARSERELVQWIVDQPAPFSVVLGALGLPPGTVGRTLVTDPFVRGSGKPGDIDLLLSNPDSPHRAVAIEFKRVRVRSGPKEGQHVNRLEDVGSAPAQVNGLRRLGFNRTYLGVIAVVHDLSDLQYNFLFRGTREDTLSRVVHVVEELPLDPEVGILYVEIAQPLEDSINRSGVVGAGIIEPAVPVEQSHDLTAMVERYAQEQIGRA